LQRDIFKWLSSPNPWKNHHTACKLRHHWSAEWFIQGDAFSEWKSSDVPVSLLWVHGKRASILSSYALPSSEIFDFVVGTGKTILWWVKLSILASRELIVLASSAIIDDIYAMRKSGLVSLAFFYCDFREDQKKDLRGVLSSFLTQLYYQSDSYARILSMFYSDHDNGLRPPSDDALAGCLKDLLRLPGQAPVYLIVDALDECPDSSAILSPRAELLNLIEDLVESQIPNLRICVTSRPEIDIRDVLDPLSFRSVSLDKGEQKDIKDYIKSVIHVQKWWKAEHSQLIIDVFTGIRKNISC
jgi:hypothetical protein